ncbi:transposase [Paraburkholderia ferrariae]|uniref:transposase n=1 Tax=Paraburkholderia ferrariae TaxID=386056 RepID=UPI0006945C76|nr:transposase [Paraburkholderia ferrariae]
MNFEELSDDEWTLVSTLVADEPPIRLNRRGRPRAEPRVVANAVLWILSTGESWSRLPARYPSGPTCRRRFDEWHVNGTLIEIVKRLSVAGRNFVYVPEPAVPRVPSSAPAVEAVAVEAVEDDGLPAVYWKSPEAWQAPQVPAHAAVLADPIESMTRQLARTDPADPGRPERTQAARPRTQAAASPAHAGAQTLARPRDESPAAARRVPGRDHGGVPQSAQSVQVAEWHGYVMHLTVQPVRNRMYRAAVEIHKDGKRLERSGLIGPPFQDRDGAKHFAFDWARKWIEHECRGEPGETPGAQSATRVSGGVVTRPVPGSVAAPGNVRHAPLQRYSASGALLPPADGRDANASACNGERRSAEAHFRPLAGSRAS